MRRYLALFACCCLLAACNNGPDLADIPFDPIYRYAGVGCPYHTSDRMDTPAPRGYKPFYISHYGRHGSRFITKYSHMAPFMKMLSAAEAEGNLTALGTGLKRDLDSLYAYFDGNWSQLSDLGAREHRDIATRMYYRFRNVWKNGGRVNAVASYEGQRCIISMANALLALKNLEPGLDFNMRTGEGAYYELMGPKLDPCVRNASNDSVRVTLNAYPNIDGMMAKWFKAPADYIDPADACVALYYAWQVQGCLDFRPLDILDYMTEEDLAVLCNQQSDGFHACHCISKDFGRFSQEPAKPVLAAIVGQADAAISGESGLVANLRYSHDSGLGRLFSLMGMEGFTDTFAFNEAHEAGWCTSDRMPMATNLQMVFYRSRKSDRILVKCLVNEKESSVKGVEPVSGPYYDWADLKKVWM